MQATGISAAELQARRETLLEHVRSNGLNGYVLFGEDYIQYFTGFGFLATERPVAFASTVSGDVAVFVPEFEVERVRAETEFDRVESYVEYPGTEPPLRILAHVLRELGFRGPAGADQDGYPGILGYQGPALSEVTEQRVVPLAPFIESMIIRKSEAEVALIRESARWCERAHRLLQQYTRPGATEAEASLRAGHEATLAMLETLGAAYGGQQASSDGVSAGYRGQKRVGARGRPQHQVPGGGCSRHGDERARVGLQRRARAGDDHRHAHRRDAPPLRSHGRGATGSTRLIATGCHVC